MHVRCGRCVTCETDLFHANAAVAFDYFDRLRTCVRIHDSTTSTCVFISLLLRACFAPLISAASHYNKLASLCNSIVSVSFRVHVPQIRIRFYQLFSALLLGHIHVRTYPHTHAAAELTETIRGTHVSIQGTEKEEKNARKRFRIYSENI